jgi:acyl carrier protein
VNELRAHLRERLPEYMVPWSFEYLDRLPLNANGKVDREALPKPHRPASARGFVSPRTDVEKQVAAVCTEILGLNEPGVFDNLFALGCNSIKATVIVSRLRTTFGTALPLQSFFEAPTIEELTIAIAKSQLEHISNEERATLLAQLESLTLEELQLTLDNSNGSNSIY